jgi:MFS family permease
LVYRGSVSQFWGPTFAALRVREFRILWIGTWLSFVAFFMSTIVQSVVAFELEGVNTAVGWVVFAQGIAMLILSPIGGALADRLPKRRVIATGQGITSLVFLTVAALVATERIEVLYLALGSLVMGATFSFMGPARQALVVDVVPEDNRGNAIALSQVANTGSRVIGPILAGVLLAWSAAGAAGAYAVMSVLYATGASLLLLLPKSRVREGARARPLFEDVFVGLRYVAGTRRLRILLSFYTLIIMIGFPHVTLLPGLLENELGHAAADVSGLFLAAAIGALSASLVGARVADSPKAPLYFTGSGLTFGVGLVALAAVPSYPGAILCMLGLGAGSGGFQTLGSAMAAREADPQYIGRVLSLTMLAFAGFGLIGLPVGILADRVGERPVMAGMGIVVCGLVGLFGVLSLRRPSSRTSSTGSMVC